MTIQYAGTRERKELPPLMKPRDSKIVSAMKAVLKMGRKNMPKMPSVMKKAEGM